MKNRAHHDARIKNMTLANKQKTMAALQRWLDDESLRTQKILKQD